MIFKNKPNYLTNDESNHWNKRVERKNETNKNCETNYTEIWNNLPEIDANKVFNPNTEHESLKSKIIYK